MAEAKPTLKHTASWHTSAYRKKHAEASKPDELETVEKPRKWFVSTQLGALWLWERVWDWPFVAWIVAAICVGLAYLVAQEHMYLVSRALVGIGIVLVFLKVHHSVRKADMATGAKRAVSVMTAIFLILLGAGGFWILGEMQKAYAESIPRADLHVDEVTVEFQDMTKAYGAMSGLLGSSWPGGILVHIKGHNQSPSTPTSPYPMVKAAISARPYITNPDEEKALFTQGKWSNEAYVGFPYVLNPGQTFSFSKKDVFTVLDASGALDTGNIFFDNWNALKRGDIVLYVVTRAIYRDKWGKVPEVRTCSVFSGTDAFATRRSCSGQFTIGTYQP